MEEHLPIIIFAFSMFCIILFYILICRRINELEGKMMRWQELQVDYNKSQHELNVEASRKFKELNDWINTVETNLNQEIVDRHDLSDKVGELNSKVYNLSFQTPNARVDTLGASFRELKDHVEKYEEILLDHAMGI